MASCKLRAAAQPAVLLGPFECDIHLRLFMTCALGHFYHFYQQQQQHWRIVICVRTAAMMCFMSCMFAGRYDIPNITIRCSTICSGGGSSSFEAHINTILSFEPNLSLPPLLLLLLLLLLVLWLVLGSRLGIIILLVVVLVAARCNPTAQPHRNHHNVQCPMLMLMLML